MKSLKFKLVLAVSVFVVIVGAVSYSLTLAIVTRPENRGKLPALGQLAGANQTLLGLTSLGSKPVTPTRFRIDPKRSDLMVRAFSGGVLWFKGHDHFVRPSDYSGCDRPCLVIAYDSSRID